MEHFKLMEVGQEWGHLVTNWKAGLAVFTKMTLVFLRACALL